MKSAILYSCFVFIFGASVHAQQLKGKVVDNTGQPIEGTYIYNLQTKSHTHANANGDFEILDSKVGDSLRAGCMGFRTKTVLIEFVTPKAPFKIVLENKIFELEELVISEQINPLKSLAQMDLKTAPVNSSQDLLRKVPGLFIGQHAGGGKAEQLFLRGFDVDHGTDVSISVDGMPVNMVSHAHGQGYSDLHFLIPETIKEIDFGKGPYYGETGDFNTAGYVKFKTKEALENNSVSMSVGQFNSIRTLGLFNLSEKNSKDNAYMAVEYIETDGPTVSPQNFNRMNLFGKYTTFLKENSKLSLNVSHFTSRWDASGQIPQRAVDNGSISRFGSIDDAEGGNTQRTNINIENSVYLDNNAVLKTNAYYIKNNFELYSNFTFFLEDPINGDQIKQKEDRSIYGVNTQLSQNTDFLGVKTQVTSGAGIRHDVANDTELSHTANRKTTLNTLKLGDINQTNIYAFTNTEFIFGKLKVAPSLRVDYFNFMYNDKLATKYQTQAVGKGIVSPKLNFVYTQNQNLQWYVKSGIGFHSNDTRVVVNNPTENVLPKAYGADFGTIWKPFSKLVIKSAVWYLFLEQEFVYVGDAAVVEPSGKTQRYGLDLGLRYQLIKGLYFDSDATFTSARSIEDPSGQNYIPLAPLVTVAGGLSFSLNKWSGGIRYRYLGNRPANEDYSLTAKGYFVSDANINYTLKKWTVGIAVENIFNTQWNETQFATETRLKNESSPVEEIHFTPGTPFFFKGTITHSF